MQRLLFPIVLTYIIVGCLSKQRELKSVPPLQTTSFNRISPPLSLDATSLRVAQLKAETYKLRDYQAALITLEADASADFIAYRTCQDQVCKEGSSWKDNFLLINLPLGLNQISVRACVEPKRAKGDNCGPSRMVIYKQEFNAKTQLGSLLEERYDKAQNIQSATQKIKATTEAFELAAQSEDAKTITPEDKSLDYMLENYTQQNLYLMSDIYSTETYAELSASGDAKQGLFLANDESCLDLVAIASLDPAELKTFHKKLTPSPISFLKNSPLKNEFSPEEEKMRSFQNLGRTLCLHFLNEPAQLELDSTPSIRKKTLRSISEWSQTIFENQQQLQHIDQKISSVLDADVNSQNE